MLSREFRPSLCFSRGKWSNDPGLDSVYKSPVAWNGRGKPNQHNTSEGVKKERASARAHHDSSITHERCAVAPID